MGVVESWARRGEYDLNLTGPIARSVWERIVQSTGDTSDGGGLEHPLPSGFVRYSNLGRLSVLAGPGGGLKELLQWSGLFGLIAVSGCLYLVPSRGPKHGDQHWAPLLGLFGGYLLGLLWAVLAFTTKNGPTPGDWWVCPAMSCVGILGSALRIRIKTVQSWKKHPLG